MPPKTSPHPTPFYFYFNWERLIQSFCHQSYDYWWLQTESWLHSSGVIGNCRCEEAISTQVSHREPLHNGSMKNTYITLMLKRWMCIAATHWVQSLTGDILQHWQTGARRPGSVHSVCGSEPQKRDVRGSETKWYRSPDTIFLCKEDARVRRLPSGKHLCRRMAADIDRVYISMEIMLEPGVVTENSRNPWKRWLVPCRIFITSFIYLFIYFLLLLQLLTLLFFITVIFKLMCSSG